MNVKADCVAVDIGASSGKVILGSIEDNVLHFSTLYRFENIPLETKDGTFWNIDALYDQIVQALLMHEVEAVKPKSIGIDTWAVDYVLTDSRGKRKTPCYSYRDERTVSIPGILFRTVHPCDLYAKTGIQIQRFNTLFQLFCGKQKTDFSPGDTFLMIPDYLNYLLTGRKTNEASNLSTTQCCFAGSAVLDPELLLFTGLTKTNFPSLVKSGDTIGPCTEKRLLQLPYSKSIEVTAPCTHDTASAVCAVPCADEEPLFISSGTWTLMGVELDRPVITEKAFKANFSNEAGYGGKTCFLKNIMGLWLLQRLQKELPGEYSFNDMEEAARTSAEGMRSLINPQDDCFLNPASMKDAVISYCKNHGQPVPDTPQRLIRCVYDSLCLSFKLTLDEIIECTGKTFKSLYIIGGGCRDSFLCQLTSDMTGLEVTAGPEEAAAIGNCLVQFIAQGKIGSLSDARAMLKNSVKLTTYYPEQKINIQAALYRMLSASPA